MALAFILSRSDVRQSESRRTAVGLVALGVVVLALLNAGIYQAALRGVTQRTLDHLTSLTTFKRAQIEHHLEEARRRAKFLANDPSVRTAAWLASRGQLDAARAEELSSALGQPQRALDFEAVVLVVGNAVVLTSAESGRGNASGADAIRLARSAVRAGDVVFGELLPSAAGGLETMVAASLPAGAAAPEAALVIVAALPGAAGNLLSQWPGVAGRARGYLVRRDGDALLLLPLGSAVARRVPLGSPSTRAAEIAAAGVETVGEAVDAAGRPLLICTRFLRGVGWSLVGEAPRGVVMTEMKSVTTGLLLLDLAIAVGAILQLIFWRRRYAAGLAAREVEVTRRHAERIQAIFDTAFDAILTFGRDGKLRTANRAAERLLGRGAAELEGQPIRSCLHWGKEGGEASLPAPGTVGLARGLRAGGQRFPAEVSLGHAGEGEDLVYTAIVRDISERVQAEEQIRTFAEGLKHSNRRLEEVNAQLEEASRLKSEFLANTSHELRTPLNGMIGFLQLVLDGMCNDDEEEREFLNQALACSRHLLGLINDVLDIAKIEAGKLSLEISRVEIEQLFAEVYTLTHVQAAQKGIALRFVPPGGGALPARADFNKTKQVLVNLVSNSLKFTEKGSVTVKATPHAELGHVTFEVVDTGIGIPPERQKVIFDKFIQADGSTTRRYGGTGLGLAISRSLVELMGGVIGVQSEGSGKGTRLYFSLPSWSEAAPEPGAPVDADRIQGPEGGALVLIVEDDPAFRLFVCTLLHKHGHRTLEASSAEQGWLLARRHAPAVVVLDYALSCAEDARLRTGWDLAERMTTTPETRHIPLVFVTGFDAELREKLHSAAFARRPEHLTKPIDGDALLAKIEEVLGARAGRGARVLLAEDDPAVAAFVRKVLPEHRFQLELARNGEECLHLLRTQPRGFDLLLLDLMMPEVSGYDVLREMVLTGTASDLPVLVLTNFPEPRDEEERRLLRDGLVVDVLPKLEVHENPALLAHLIDWHVQVAAEGERREAA